MVWNNKHIWNRDEGRADFVVVGWGRSVANSADVEWIGERNTKLLGAKQRQI